ncbi:MAG TPA: hypothetical protein VNG51_15975 [Ktedonobacteraceae bacterium]|nr:hypothetical protein [Ktedonobacteraceae bacterium]
MDEPRDAAILHVRLPGLLPMGRVLALHQTLSVLLCLACECEQGEPLLQCVELLTPKEARALVPLLQSYPAYAPYALVWAGMEGIPVAEAQAQVHVAQSQGEQSWVAFIQPVRSLLSGLRRTLHRCDLDIVAVLQKGYLLKHWKHHP